MNLFRKSASFVGRLARAWGFSGVFLNTNEKGIQADKDFIDAENKVVEDYLGNLGNTLGLNNRPKKLDPYKNNEPISLETAVRASTYSHVINTGMQTKSKLKVANDAYISTVNAVSGFYEDVVDFFKDVGYKTNEAIYNVNHWGQ